MKTLSLSPLLLAILVALPILPSSEASPRRQRDLTFPRNEALVTTHETAMQVDGEAQRREEQASAIRRESRPGPALTRRPEGETYTQYRERMEAARLRLEADGIREENLKADQREEIYRAMYAMRRETFGGSHSPHGQGAGPGGERHQPPMDLGRLWNYLFAPSPEEEDDATEEASD